MKNQKEGLRRMRRVRFVISLTSILLIFGVLWQGNQGAEHPYPCVAFSHNDTTWFSSTTGGRLYADEAGNVVEPAWFDVQFPLESSRITQGTIVKASGADDTIEFMVDYHLPLSGVQVLRWPFSTCGTTAPLDTAERIAYSTTTQYDGLEKQQWHSAPIESGYLYSIYITWDQWFVSHDFSVE